MGEGVWAGGCPGLYRLLRLGSDAPVLQLNAKTAGYNKLQTAVAPQAPKSWKSGMWEGSRKGPLSDQIFRRPQFMVKMGNSR